MRSDERKRTSRLDGSVSDDASVDSTESFEAFFDREYRNIVGLAVVLSGSRWAAEDLAQDAFEVAHRRWARISRYDDPGAWVRRVVANMAVSTIRRRTREARALLRLRARGRSEVELPEPVGRFWDAVRRLPRRQAQCVALHYFDDLAISRIAEVLGMNESTVRVHLHRGRLSLADMIGEPAEDEL